MAGQKLCFLFVVLLALLLPDTGTSIQIRIQPKQEFPSGKFPTATIACTLDALEKPAREITSMKIVRKGGRIIAFSSPDFTVTYNNPNANEEDMAEGKIEAGVEEQIMKSYLNMTLKDPDIEDTGMYTCIVEFVTESGTTLANKANMYLRVGDPEVKSLGRTIKEALKKLDKQRNKIRKISENADKDMSSMGVFEMKTKSHVIEIADITEKQRKSEGKANRFEGKTLKRLDTLQEFGQKQEAEVKKMKGTVKNVEEKMKKYENELSEIVEKETKDHWKVSNLVKKADKEAKEMDYLYEKEKNMEKTVKEIQLNIKQTLDIVKDVNEETSVNIIEVKSASLEKFFTKGQAKDIEDLKNKEKKVEEKLIELEKKFDEYSKIFDSLDVGDNDDDNGNDDSNVDDDDGDKGDDDDDDGGGGGGAGSGSFNSSSYAMIAFAATNQEQLIEIKKRKTVVFPDMIFFQENNATGNYDEKTGEFTAPIDGIYHFSLVVKLDCVSCHVVLDLKVVKRLIFRVKVGVMFDDPQGSASSVVQLKANDKVKLVVNSTSDGAALSPGRFCVFSGHLVAPV